MIATHVESFFKKIQRSIQTDNVYLSKIIALIDIRSYIDTLI